MYVVVVVVVCSGPVMLNLPHDCESFSVEHCAILDLPFAAMLASAAAICKWLCCVCCYTLRRYAMMHNKLCVIVDHNDAQQIVCHC